MRSVGQDAIEDPYHFGTHLISEIRSRNRHEIASHTFSHYYCLEPTQSVRAFAADLESAKKVAQEFGVDLRSIVFPRNQYDEKHLSVIRDHGFTSYRGNEPAWFYTARAGSVYFSLPHRLFRLLDTYFNLSGPNIYDPADLIRKGKPYNLQASRMLRPYSKARTLLDPIRLRRICSSMTRAAQEGKIYHLWWHPHNFGVDQDENLEFLSKILDCNRSLKDRYGFQSLTMGTLAELLEKKGSSRNER